MQQSSSRVKGWTFGDLLLEKREGAPPLVPPHSHDTYQIGFTTRMPGAYFCDGREWIAPPVSVILFHPDEVHEVVGGGGTRPVLAPARAIYVTPQRLSGIVSDVCGKDSDAPFFPDRVILDKGFVQRFVRTHELIESSEFEMEKDSALLDLLAELVTRHGTASPARKATRDQARARLVRTYIDDNPANDLSLAGLAAIAHVSPFHLNRVFRREVGMPPHAYQNQVRIERAKALLLRGVGAAEAALQTGFFDQSHFGRHFRRIVGVSPGHYIRLS